MVQIDMKHKISRSLGLLSTAAACLLSAQTVFAMESWNFEPESWGGQTQSIIGSPGGVLNAEAWAMPYGGSFQQATFTEQGSLGFGIQHAGESDLSPHHALDNEGGFYDFVLFEFDGQYAVESATAGWARESGGYDSPEADFYYWAPNTDPTDGTGIAGTDLSGWTLLQKAAFDENNTPDEVTVNPGAVASKYWLVAANTCDATGATQPPNQSCSPSTRNDAFKLLALTATEAEDTTIPPGTTVPEPATALLLVGALPFLRRRWLTK